MKKLCTIIMLGFSVWVYGQKASEKETVIKKEHKELMHRLLSFEEKYFLSKKIDAQQFLLEDTLILPFGIENKNLYTIHDKLRKNKDKKIVTPATGEDSRVKMMRQDSVDNCVYYETNCEVHTIVEKDSIISNAKFDVAFEWKGVMPKKPKKSKVFDKLTVEKIRVTPKKYTTKELTIAKAEIKKWYEKDLKEEYRNESVAPLVVMSKVDDIKLNWNDQNKKFTTKGPKVKITVPWEINAEDSIYYEPNPVAYYELTPSFTISMKPDWKKKTLTAAIDTVVCEKGSIVSPIKKVVNEEQTLSETDREQREVALMTFVQRFRIEHMKFAGRQTEKGRRLLESMFTDKETGIVEVAKLIDFQERINSRIAKDYLSRLRGRLSVKLLKEQVQYNPTMDIVIFPFEQRYSSLDGKYKDETTKKLYLRYVDGNYFIERITVVPNTTHLITIK